MICKKVKPSYLVLVIPYAGFLMYQEVAFSALLFEVAALLVSYFEPLLSF